MGKKAIVTGASEGIGRSFARMLAANEYAVTAVARSETKLNQLINELGHDHKYIVADLSIPEGQAIAIEELNSERYHLLVNNAGFGALGAFAEIPLERQLAMLHLNCEAVVNLSYAFLNRAQPGDALLNVSSTLGFTSAPKMALYCATKAFIKSFSEALWYEQKSRGVYVLAMCPGITKTNFHDTAGVEEKNVVQGMAQTPDEVVETALKALAARKEPTVISGAKNRIFASLLRALPRKSAVNMMGKIMP